MNLTIICLICMVNIILFTAAGFYIKYYFKLREVEFYERMEVKRLHIERMKTLKEIEIQEKRLELEKERLEKEIEVKREEIRMNTKLNFNGDVILTLDSMVAAYTEPFIKLKYTNAEKPLEENIFSEIIVPRFGLPRMKDIDDICAKVFDDMPPDTRDILRIYMSDANMNNLVRQMVTIYYQRVMYQMTKVKEEKAIQDNRAAAKRRDWLFVKGKLNENCRTVPKEIMKAIKNMEPKNFHEVKVAIDYLKSFDMEKRDDRERFQYYVDNGASALLDFDLSSTYDLEAYAKAQGKEVWEIQ